jgi:hypothetical protein
MQLVRLFVSSPSDVGPERQRVQWIVDRLNGKFHERLQIETILWEDSIYNAHDGGFQPQIDRRAKPADCEIVLAILWGRLGTELHESFPERQADGTPYPSGTAYEILSALAARKASGTRPDVYVFRKLAPVQVPVDNAAALQEASNQWQRLQAFSDQHFALADKRVLRAVEKFREIDEFEQKIERLLREWIRSHTPQDAVWSIEEKGSPFRGLEPFDAKHADVYFGRDRKVRRALDELLAAAQRGNPFLLIPGASGSGKSSLMRAAMAPRVVQPGVVQGVDLWRVAVMRPGTDGHPMLALSRALFVTGDEKKDDPGGFGKALPELAGGAFQSPERLSELFMGATDLAVDPIVHALDQVAKAESERRRFERSLQANLLLLVDQLEDIFSSSIAVEERRKFAELLAALVRTQRVWVIATLRADMYHRMITDRPFIVLKDLGGQFDLSPPGHEELDEIIHRSAAAAGLTYECRLVGDAESGQRRECLDDLLLRDATGENTLPLLQFTLNLLFDACWGGQQSKVLSIAAYQEIGGLDGAINQTAEAALVELVRPGVKVRFPLKKEVADEIAATLDTKLESLLRKLVAPVSGETQGAAAAGDRALTSRIVAFGEAKVDDATGRMIEALLHARILHSTRLGPGSTLRISHDRVITSWERASVMTERNRDFYRIRDSIEHALQRWEDSGRSKEFLLPAGAQVTQADEKIRQFPGEFTSAARNFVDASIRRVRLWHRLTAAAAVVFAIVAVVATGSFWYATEQRKRAIQHYEAARETVGKLVSDVAAQLRDLDGIQLPTVQKALNEVELGVRSLEKQNSTDVELKRIRGSMNFEFAKAFQNARNLDLALAQAQAAFDIRRVLVSGPAPSDWRADYAASLDQLGDIHRQIAINLEQKHDPSAPAEFIASRKFLDDALGIRTELHEADPHKVEWAICVSQSLVRIGDDKLVGFKKDPAGAQADYRRALELTCDLLKHDPNNVAVVHEYSWCLNKTGDVLKRKDPVAGLVAYEQALSARRFVANCDPTNSLWKRDVTFSLERVSEVKAQLHDLSGAEESLFESLQLRRELYEHNPAHMLYLKDLGTTLHLIGKLETDRKQLAAAAGFFEMATEIRQQLAQRVPAERQAIAKQVNESSEGRKQSIRQASAETNSEEFVQSGKRRALEVEAEMANRLQKRHLNPVTSWTELAAAQLQQSK